MVTHHYSLHHLFDLELRLQCHGCVFACCCLCTAAVDQELARQNDDLLRQFLTAAVHKQQQQANTQPANKPWH